VVDLHRNDQRQIVPTQVSKTSIGIPAALESKDDLQRYLGEKKHGNFEQDVSISRRKEFGTSTQIHHLEVVVPHPDRDQNRTTPLSQISINYTAVNVE